MISSTMRRITVVSALIAVIGVLTAVAAVSAAGASHPQRRQLAVATLSRFRVVLTITRGSGDPPMGTVTAVGYRRSGSQWTLIARNRVGKANGWFWFSTDTCSLTTRQLQGVSPVAAADSIRVSLLVTPAIGCSRPIGKHWQP
jgi:hypothetical protein